MLVLLLLPNFRLCARFSLSTSCLSYIQDTSYKLRSFKMLLLPILIQRSFFGWWSGFDPQTLHILCIVPINRVKLTVTLIQRSITSYGVKTFI